MNPLLWSTSDAPADKSLNLGAVFYDDVRDVIVRDVPHYCGAQIDPKTGALVTTPPDKLPLGSFPPGVYHKYDYAFWYRNLEKECGRPHPCLSEKIGAATTLPSSRMDAAAAIRLFSKTGICNA